MLATTGSRRGGRLGPDRTYVRHQQADSCRQGEKGRHWLGGREDAVERV